MMASFSFGREPLGVRARGLTALGAARGRACREGEGGAILSEVARALAYLLHVN
jgi:hypothetical protein